MVQFVRCFCGYQQAWGILLARTLTTQGNNIKQEHAVMEENKALQCGQGYAMHGMEVILEFSWSSGFHQMSYNCHDVNNVNKDDSIAFYGM